jgi:hypothetical protein
MRTLRFVPGSIVVYLVVAACSGMGTSPVSDGGGTASSGGPASDGASRVLDAITDPVPSASADTYASGSRLKVQYYAGADGSKAFAGMYDSQRNEACSFVTAADGSTRCLPVAAPSASLGVYYADASCSSPLAYAASGCTSPLYGNEFVSAACSGQGMYHIFQLGPAVNPPMVYLKSGTVCAAQQPTTAFVYYTVGPEIMPPSFAAGTLQTE